MQKKKNKKLGTNLKVILTQDKITQTKLAEMADLEIYQVSNIASGKQKDLLLSTAKKICVALNRSLDEVFGDCNLIEKE